MNSNEEASECLRVHPSKGIPPYLLEPIAKTDGPVNTGIKCCGIGRFVDKRSTVILYGVGSPAVFGAPYKRAQAALAECWREISEQHAMNIV